MECFGMRKVPTARGFQGQINAIGIMANAQPLPQTSSANAAYVLSAMGTYQISQGAQLFAHSFQRYPCMHCTDS